MQALFRQLAVLLFRTKRDCMPNGKASKLYMGEVVQLFGGLVNLSPGKQSTCQLACLTVMVATEKLNIDSMESTIRTTQN